jgi:CSLREA domain-containing protein
MRITTTLAAATALATGIFAAACDDRPVDLSDVTAPPSFSVVENGWQPFTWDWWACNEPVTIEGKYHFTSSMQENGNRWHWRWHTNWIGSGVGEYSGSTYRLSETYNGTENVTAGWTYPRTVRDNRRLTLVAQGPTTDLRGTWQWHVTVNANGITTAVIDSWELSCRDQGPPPFEGTLVVNVTDDLDDGSCDPTHCSLREALIASNSYSGTTETIAFNIPGRGPHTIQLRDGLPEVFDPVVIDGTTEPNFAGTPIVELDGSQAGEVNGLMILAGNSTVRGLVINRFGAAEGVNGIELSWNGGNVIEGNFIGTDVTGTIPLGNSNAGVMINSPNNTIGGLYPDQRNVISGNLEDGIRIDDPEAGYNRIVGNYIGTDFSGTEPLGNGGAGVVIIGPSHNIIGGLTPAARNIISANSEGISMWNGASNNRVEGNFIGTDVTGTSGLGHRNEGVVLSDGASHNIIGGLTPAARNIISANGEGIAVWGDASNNHIVGNFIGTDVTGTSGIGNDFWGVHLDDGTSGNWIGGASKGAGNVISGNLAYGVLIRDGASQNQVQGNYIGTQSDGSSPLGNSRHGVALSLGANDNTIGGIGVTPGMCSGPCNTIAFNGLPGTGYDGVRLMPTTGTGNLVIGNAIHSNAGLGIDLGADGVTLNDPGDGDTGANELQNFPELFAAYGTQTSITIEGALNSTPVTQFRLEFFANSECDPSGHGEGKIFIGEATMLTDGSGDASFTAQFGVQVPPGAWITATATDPDNNTSEFSACVEKT